MLLVKFSVVFILGLFTEWFICFKLNKKKNFKCINNTRMNTFKSILVPCFVVNGEADVIFANEPILKMINKNSYSNTKGWTFMGYNTIEECQVCKVVKTARVNKKLAEGMAVTTFNDKKFILKVYASPLYDDKNNMIGALVIIFDFTSLSNGFSITSEVLETINKDTENQISLAGNINNISEVINSDLDKLKIEINSQTQKIEKVTGNVSDIKNQSTEILTKNIAIASSIE